jgi:hypothetical protein
VREYVVMGMQRTANRQLSQFAERLTKNDVFGPDAIKVDSDKAAQIALQFGVANNMKIAALHYDLRKGASDGPPLWTVICVDSFGNELGRIVLSATRGTIIMHPGFSIEPQQVEAIAEDTRRQTNSRNLASNESDDGSTSTTTATAGNTKKTDSQAAKKISPRGKIATPLPFPGQKRNFFQRLFGQH